MKNQNSNTPQKIKNCLPIIAFMFGIYPMCILPIFGWLLQKPVLGVLATLFILSFFGIILTVIGSLLGVIALAQHKKKQTSTRNLIFSIFAIISPLIWFVVLMLGGFDYIMSYK